MTAVSVDPKARDVSFVFEDSCNCCCFRWKIRRRPHEETPVYVHDYGVVNHLDPKRTSNEIEAIRQSIQNLQRRLEYVSQVHEAHYPQVMQRIENSVGENLSEEREEPLTYGLIERINKVLREMFMGNDESP